MCSLLKSFILYFRPQQVWPSFWTLGPETTWPGSGEIDIIEAINEMDHNQVALHTTVGCYQANITTQSGSTFEIDCSTPQGCDVGENKPNSFGTSFAEAGGGVFALQLDTAGISMWFFSVCCTFIVFRLDLTLPQRPNIPPSLQQATTSSQLDISTWGIPTASYPNSTCTMETFFPPQQLVLLTTLCGVWYVQTEILILSFNLYVWYKGWNTIGLRGDLSNAYWLLCTSCPLRSKVHY